MEDVPIRMPRYVLLVFEFISIRSIEISSARVRPSDLSIISKGSPMATPVVQVKWVDINIPQPWVIPTFLYLDSWPPSPRAFGGLETQRCIRPLSNKQHDRTPAKFIQDPSGDCLLVSPFPDPILPCASHNAQCKGVQVPEGQVPAAQCCSLAGRIGAQ